MAFAEVEIAATDLAEAFAAVEAAAAGVLAEAFAAVEAGIEAAMVGHTWLASSAAVCLEEARASEELDSTVSRPRTGPWREPSVSEAEGLAWASQGHRTRISLGLTAIWRKRSPMMPMQMLMPMQKLMPMQQLTAIWKRSPVKQMQKLKLTSIATSEAALSSAATFYLETVRLAYSEVTGHGRHEFDEIMVTWPCALEAVAAATAVREAI